MSNPPGYPLPAGELGEDDIVCQLVFLPDRPEYWQAFISAIHYFATWKAWERDDDLRGKDAAANWRAANELTMECWRMACLQDLQDDVAAILAIMQLPQSCCDPGDFSDGDQYTDRVEDGVGLVPQNIVDAGYASSTSDWSGFDDYKCMISHVIVNQLGARLTEILPLVDGTGAVLGGVAALAGILAVVVGTGGLAIVFGIVAGIGATALLYQAITDFSLVEGLITKVATNHDEMACAVYNADGDDGALVALNDSIDELFTTVEALVLKNMNLGPTLKALYAGRYDQQDIAEILDDAGYDVGDFTCDCAQIGEQLLYEDWEAGVWGNWFNSGSSLREFDGEGGGWGAACWFSTGSSFTRSVASICSEVGHPIEAGDSIIIHRILFSYKMIGGSDKELRHKNIHDGGTEQTDYVWSGTWVNVEKVFSPAIEIAHGTSGPIMFQAVGGTGDYVMVDNIYIDFDIVFA